MLDGQNGHPHLAEIEAQLSDYFADAHPEQAATKATIRNYMAEQSVDFEGNDLPLSLRPLLMSKAGVVETSWHLSWVRSVMNRLVERTRTDIKRGRDSVLTRFFSFYEKWFDLIAAESRALDHIMLMQFDTLLDPVEGWQAMEPNTACPGGVIHCGYLRDAWLRSVIGQKTVGNFPTVERAADDPSGFIRFLAQLIDVPDRPSHAVICNYEGTYTNELASLEVINSAQVHGRGYAACAVQQNDTVAILGEVGRFAAEYAVIHALSTTGCTILPIVAQERVKENIEIMNDLQATVWIAMQSAMFPYLDVLEQGTLPIPTLRLIVTGGEHTSPEVAERLKSFFGEELIIRSTLQTADAGSIGYQCAYCQEGEFHILEDLQFVEIVDDTGKATKGPGRLIVTNLFRHQSPVIRVATGDRAQWATAAERCGCGRTSKRIKLLGREDSFFKLGGEKIPASMLTSFVDDLSIQLHEGRLVITRKETGQDVLTIEVKKDCLCQGLIDSVQSSFRNIEVLQTLVDQERLAPIHLSKLSSEDPLYRGFNKLIRVVDNREQAAK